MRGHRADNGLDAVDLALVELLQLLADVLRTRHHHEHLLHGAHVADLLHLGEEVIEGEVFLVGELLRHPGGFILVPGLLGLLDQGEDVTHVEDARGHAVRVEELEVVHAFAGGGEHDRLAGHRRDGERGAAAGVAVELGEHDAGEVDALVKGQGSVDGVLADHGVDHEQDFVRDDRAADLARLLHHLGVDAETAGGVHDHDVVQGALGFLDAVTGDGDRVTGRVVQFGGRGARVRGEHGYAGALADHLQLGDGVGPLEVAGHQHGAVALGLEPFGELAGQGGLAGALEARQHNDGGSGLGQADPAGLAAEDLDEFLVDDLHDLLARVQRPGDLGAEGTLAHAAGEFPDHGNSDIGVQEGTPDLADCGVNVRLGQAALATQILEGCCQPVRE
ncbi:hypothetical protein SRABI128_03676 [Microbacterium sp. Bi128]|nr:hypothetical protein SRABI128_03676 [Microbacterium sp. Bi128]